MTTASWITMAAIMAIVWGGFALALWTALRAEARKQREGEGERAQTG